MELLTNLIARLENMRPPIKWPFSFKKERKERYKVHDVFCFTDVHGMYELYHRAIDYCMAQDPECTIVYLGDACDRGQNGYKIMHELLDNPQVIYLMGNHEDIFCNAAREIKRHFDFSNCTKEQVETTFRRCMAFEDKYASICHSLYNGGLPTLIDWITDGMPMDFVERIEKLPLTFSYGNMDFCHAGGVYPAFRRAAEAEFHGDKVDFETKQMLLWDRGSFHMGWAPGRTCIFGHTPTVYLPSMYYGKDKSLANIHPCEYIGTWDERWSGKKICMDTATFFSNRLFVLNCLNIKYKNLIK